MLANRVRMGSRKKYSDIDEVYLAQDSDFVKVNDRWVYRGSELEIEIPHVIQGEEVTSYAFMFNGSGSYLATPVTRVVSNNKNVFSMSYMFYGSLATSLDLSSFDTSNVTTTSYMFSNSQATSLNLSSFDTSKVTNMRYMFGDCRALTSLDLSSFDTSKVTAMNGMFRGCSSLTSLDLSSFDTSKVTNMEHMFRYCTSIITAYARTQEDADRFNASSYKPEGLNFVVHPDLTGDFSGSPGNSMLIAGTMQEGFFGEVPASELITGDALASECGISEGTSQFSTEPWLKFAYKGEILFVAKKPIRRSISWDAINAAKCVYGDSGDKTVVIDGLTYKVTLMRALGPSNDPKTKANTVYGNVVHHSEWNRLMCQIHEEAINGSWNCPDNIESDIGILEHSLGNGTNGMYNDVDLNISGNGRLSWCQEMATSTSDRLNRGGSGNISCTNYTASFLAINTTGWRPVLRLEQL